jgi:hypothetical protein
MKTFATGRGRRKAVEKFTYREGIWMAAMISAAMITLILLWYFNIIPFDVD